MKILVVDDERAVRESLRRALELEGYEIELAADGSEALYRLEGSQEPDAMILDVLMPGVDGLEVCRRLRVERNEGLVLMLTARADVDSRVAGLDAGDEEGEAVRFGDLELDPTTREVTRSGRPIELTRTEFSLLELFMRNPRQVLTRTIIFERVWGYDFGYASNSLDVYVGYLRRKTEADGEPRLIQTVRGVGYALRES